MRSKVRRGGGGGGADHRASTAAMQQPQRFVWRERSEKLNWRMLRALHLPDVVRRGDPSVLEPFVLHLTFARLPPSAATVDAIDAVHSLGGGDDDSSGSRLRDYPPQRNAWFIVRVFQLATEYLLFMRSRDGTVLETLQHELRQCEAESEAFATRAAKWKARAKSGEKQVERLHQVLQSIAKLLQIQGATPSAVTTIETLLADLVPAQTKRRARSAPDNNDDGDATDRAAAHRRVQAARQCYYCGKMFASADFLAKHHARRHANEDSAPRMASERVPQQHSTSTYSQQDAASRSDSRTGDHALRQMLEQVEQALQDHQASLRALAQDEARKLERLYEHLHVESTLTEEMKASRVAVEQQVAAAQAQLDALESQKDGALTVVRDLQDQIQFLNAKRKVLQQQTDCDALPRSTGERPDVATALEIKRLEHTLATVNDALASAREELTALQAAHMALLREKQALVEQMLAIGSKDASTETSAERSELERVHAAVQTLAVTAAETIVTSVDEASQTDGDECEDAVVTTAPDDRESVQLTVDTTASEAATASSHDADSVVTDYIYNIVTENATDAVTRRAQRAASEAAAVQLQHAIGESAASIPTRASLRSRYPHDEHAVADRIAAQMVQLEQRAQRFGVPPECRVLSNDHLAIVQSALHGHLEILPAHVLERMIAIESSTNATIAREWVPREKTRQRALAQLKLEHDAKSQQNQDLVKQAMRAFATGDSALEPSHSLLSRSNDDSSRSSRVSTAVAMVEAQPRDAAHTQWSESGSDAALRPLDPVQQMTGTPVCTTDVPIVADARGEKLTPSAAHDTRLLIETAVRDESNVASRVESAEANALTRSAQAEKDAASEHQAAESPVTEDKSDAFACDQRAEEQVAKPRGLKVVTVSPKASPTKSASAVQEHDSARSPPSEDLLTAQTAPPADENAEARELTLRVIEVKDEEDEEKEADDSDDTAKQPLSVPPTHSTSRDEDEERERHKPEATQETQPLPLTSVAADEAEDDDGLEVLHLESASDIRTATAAAADTSAPRAVDSHDPSYSDLQIREIDEPDDDEQSDRETASSYSRMLQSVQSSEFAASIAASSDVSFQTSIPSLGASSSDDVRASDTMQQHLDERRGSRESGVLATAHSTESSVGESPVPRRHVDDSDDNDDEIAIPDLLSDDEQRSYDEAREQTDALPTQQQQEHPSPRSQPSRNDSAGPPVTSVMSFDDDSEIEEMELT